MEASLRQFERCRHARANALQQLARESHRHIAGALTEVFGGPEGIRDRGLLDSALHRWLRAHAQQR